MAVPIENDSFPPRQRSLFAVTMTCALAAAAIALFTGLGAWQLHRLQWKLDLIQTVGRRVGAAPAPPPGAAEWDGVTAKNDAYRHVAVRGVYLHDKETLVKAVTEYGAGYWVMTPLRTGDASHILVNRGFVPEAQRAVAMRTAGNITGEVVINGLLRVTESGGGFLRANAPQTGRWYSRDVAAIAAARHLSTVAPYFIDVDATPNPGGLPIGGLTVVTFRNDHLVYAVTWFLLAIMAAVFICLLLRRETRLRYNLKRAA